MMQNRIVEEIDDTTVDHDELMIEITKDNSEQYVLEIF